MLSSAYISVKSAEMDISHVNITRWTLHFLKVGEWVTGCGYVSEADETPKTDYNRILDWSHGGPFY